MCISPLNMPRPNGRGYFDRVTVPCGKCAECLAKKRADWSFRLNQELKVSESAFFITLTYNEESNIGDLDKRHIQLFLKRLRRSMNMKVKYIKKEVKNGKLRYFLVGEYGPLTNRPHYHIIMFNLPQGCVGEIEDIWGKGQIKVGNVTPASIHYVTKYVINKNQELLDKDTGELIERKPFAMMSLKPGLGSNYLEDKNLMKYHKKNGSDLTVNLGGHKQRLPRFYQDKIFNIAEKDKIKDNLTKEADKIAEKIKLNDEQYGNDYFKHDLERKIEKTNKMNKLKKGGITI